jgi:stage II sporulation protein D
MDIETIKETGGIIRSLLRFTAAIFITLLVWGCGAVPHLKEGSETSYIRLPFVRVLLENGSPELTISGGSSFAIECVGGGKNVVYYSSRPITVRTDEGLISLAMGKTRINDSFEEINIMPRSDRELLSYRNQKYRGMLRVIPHGINLRLINIIHMDDYLRGVVPPEMGTVTEADSEAIKAQAVAARTYSLGHLSQYAGEPYDMRSDVADQLYQGASVETPLISRAIDETRGYVIKYGDNLINAYYHSTCGGSTDYIEEVWDKPAAPYLRAVADSGACGWSKYSHWRETYRPEQMKMMIEQYLSSERGREIHIGDLEDISITARTAGGRVAEMEIRTADRTYTFGGDKVRWIFRRSSNPELILQSARFDVRTEFDSSRRLTRIELDGSGYGHGVGMCQCGAMGMSHNGRKFDQILAFYYPNTKLVKLY